MNFTNKFPIMSNEKKHSSESTTKQESGKLVVNKGNIHERSTFSDSPIKEGYQPSDKLDTSRPPTDQGPKDKK